MSQVPVVATRGDAAAWLVLVALPIFSVPAPLNQFKVPPIMPIRMAWIKVSAGKAELIMSVFAVTGLVLALPAA